MLRDVSFSVVYFPLFAHLNSLGPRKADGSGAIIMFIQYFYFFLFVCFFKILDISSTKDWILWKIVYLFHFGLLFTKILSLTRWSCLLVLLLIWLCIRFSCSFGCKSLWCSENQIAVVVQGCWWDPVSRNSRCDYVSMCLYVE